MVLINYFIFDESMFKEKVEKLIDKISKKKDLFFVLLLMKYLVRLLNKK
jgi:hypothetical protein